VGTPIHEILAGPKCEWPHRWGDAGAATIWVYPGGTRYAGTTAGVENCSSELIARLFWAPLTKDSPPLRRESARSSLGGLCVEVTVPASPSFRFSPVGLDEDGAGLCVELALPIVCPEESCGPIACPEESCEEGFEAPPAFSPKDSVVVPAKRAIASTAAPRVRSRTGAPQA